MKIQQKPIIHGRDHMPGGADPIPQFSTGFTTYKELILADGPWAYWPFDDTAGPTLHEEIAGRDMAVVEKTTPAPGPYLLGYGETGPFVDDSGTSIEFAGYDSGVISNMGTNAHYDLTVGEYGDVFVEGSWTVELWFAATSPPVVLGQDGVPDYRGVLVALGKNTGGASDRAWAVYLDETGQVVFVAGGSDTVPAVTITGPVAVGGFHHVAVVHDGTTFKLYLGGVLVGTGTTGSYLVTGGNRFQVGRQTDTHGSSYYFEGRLAHVVIFDEALDADTIGKHMAGDLGAPAPGSGWQFPPPPPAEGGGPVGTGSPPGGWTGGTNPGGYYYQAHIETIVLTDSSPGRFDVPPRTWTRIPFNHAQIQRQFQPNSSSPGTVNRLLPDDRGLTSAAQNGVLLLPDAAYKLGDPTPDVQVLAWCNPEYPILDGVRLPNGGNPLLVDLYVRALRIRNATTGHVLRDPDFEDGTWRMFFEWPFWQPADGDVGLVHARSTDNPYPAYPPWPGRPLHKPLPYPELPGGISEWLSYYQNNETGYPGWHVIGPEAHFAPGTKFIAEVWQDTPYLLRFTTNVYPHQPPILTMPGWTGGPLYNLWQPYLTVSYPFDPATIDHTTGVLL